MRFFHEKKAQIGKISEYKLIQHKSSKKGTRLKKYHWEIP